MTSNSTKCLLPLICLAALTARGGGDPALQPQVNFYQAAQGKFNADWEGVAGRTYFMHFSPNLVDWYYAPFIAFGEGPQSRGIDRNGDKFFVRLRYLDDPNITSLDEAMNADFDGDGLSNIFEITQGYDPFDGESTMDGADALLDPDSDGLGNAAEQAARTNPMTEDNPFLQLEVLVD